MKEANGLNSKSKSNNQPPTTNNHELTNQINSLPIPELCLVFHSFPVPDHGFYRVNGLLDPDYGVYRSYFAVSEIPGRAYKGRRKTVRVVDFL